MQVKIIRDRFGARFLLHHVTSIPGAWVLRDTASSLSVREGTGRRLAGKCGAGMHVKNECDVWGIDSDSDVGMHTGS